MVVLAVLRSQGLASSWSGLMARAGSELAARRLPSMRLMRSAAMMSLMRWLRCLSSSIWAASWRRRRRVALARCSARRRSSGFQRPPSQRSHLCQRVAVADVAAVVAEDGFAEGFVGEDVVLGGGVGGWFVGGEAGEVFVADGHGWHAS